MATIQPNTDYMINNYNSGKSWAVKGEDASNGASLVQFDVVTNPAQKNQRFQFVKVPDQPNLYYIMTTPAFGNFYVSVDNGSGYGNNAGLNIYTDPDAYATWKLSLTDTGQILTITNNKTGKLVDVKGDSTGNNAWIVIYDQNNQADQQWSIVQYS